VVDCDLPWRKALRLAWAAAGPHLLKLTLIYFLLMVIAYGGLLLFYVGAFVTGALASIALVFIYEDAFGGSLPQEPTEQVPK
jgi:hypothetical protein